MKSITIAFILFVVLTGFGLAQPPDASNPDRGKVTIANGGTVSTELSLSGCTPVGIIIASGWTGGTSLTFQVSVDGTNFLALYDEYGSAVTVTVAASRYVRLSPGDWWGVSKLKLVSGTTSRAETPQVICK